MPEEIWTKLPLFLVVAGFLILTVPRLAEASEPLAKWFGPIGRYFRQRSTLRNNAARVERAAEAKALIGEMIAQQPVIDVMRRELTSVMDRLATLESVVTIQRAFIAHDEAAHFDADLKLAQEGRKPLPRLSFTDFAAKWKDGWRPE